MSCAGIILERAPMRKVFLAVGQHFTVAGAGHDIQLTARNGQVISIASDEFTAVSAGTTIVQANSPLGCWKAGTSKVSPSKDCVLFEVVVT